MIRRPWRIEYQNAEGEWHSLSRSRYATRDAAVNAIEHWAREQNPGVLLRVEKHVEFEASH